MASDPPAALARRPANRLFIPRPHRLFAVFPDRASAEAALAAAPADTRRDTWLFEGFDGAAELSPDTGGLRRIFSWIFSHNVEFLHELARMVGDGRVVVAVPARTLAAASAIGAELRRRDGTVIAYTAHWNFVPA